MVIGRYLLSLDTHLKEAAIYTIGRLALRELEPAVRKIQHNEPLSQDTLALIKWSLERIADAAGGIRPQGSHS